MFRRLTLLAALLLAPGVASATLLMDWSLDELVARSDLVFVGVVQAQSYLEVEGELMTETEVAVESVLSGPPTAAITLSQLGGRRGSVIAEIVGDAQLSPGMRVLLFTYAHPDGRRYLVGMSLGAYEVKASGELVQRLEVDLVDQNGKVRPAHGARASSIKAVVDAIQRARR